MCALYVRDDVQTVTDIDNSNTKDMIFTINECIEWITKEKTLLPGTVILTGVSSN